MRFLTVVAIWLAFSLSLFVGCAGEKSAKEGDTVKIKYTGKLEDGTIFDSSEGRDPIQFKIGDGNVIPGFEKGVIGMKVGDKKTLTIPAEEAYGPVRQEYIAQVPINSFPPNITPAVGLQLQMQQPDSNVVRVTITDIKGDTVTIDANHPLAGKTLIFDIELAEIVPVATK